MPMEANGDAPDEQLAEVLDIETASRRSISKQRNQDEPRRIDTEITSKRYLPPLQPLFCSVTGSTRLDRS